jgi:hypothetical protein
VIKSPSTHVDHTARQSPWCAITSAGVVPRRRAASDGVGGVRSFAPQLPNWGFLIGEFNDNFDAKLTKLSKRQIFNF